MKSKSKKEKQYRRVSEGYKKVKKKAAKQIENYPVEISNLAYNELYQHKEAHHNIFISNCASYKDAPNEYVVVKRSFSHSKKRVNLIVVPISILAKLCQIQCTIKEIEFVTGISIDTISYQLKRKIGMDFSEFAKQNKLVGKISLRRAQFLNAIENGSVAMQIWLGKNYLGQADQPETNSEIASKIAEQIAKYRQDNNQES